MKIMYANVPNVNYPRSIYQTEPFIIGNIKYYGYKIIPQIESNEKNGQGNYEYVDDENATPIYDEITQLFIDRNNLQSLLAQLTAQNAKSNIDMNELKKQNAMLTQQIAMLQTKGDNQ